MEAGAHGDRGITMDEEAYDARDGSGCIMTCILSGECQNFNPPALREDGNCWWYGMNAQMSDWYEPDPAHRRT